MSDVQFPKWANFLFKPARYKVARGGRGSGKSWSFARALLVIAAQKPTRILCTREIQKSIKDSVHKLLSDQIQAMGLGSFYTVLNTEIRGKNGSEFLFSGLQDHTVDSIKSYEGVDIVWVEEAHSVSKKSWEILTPTIRKSGSEIWITFNPSLDTDETYTRFVVNPPPDCVSVLVNYTENPWFTDVLEQERLHCLKANPKDYPNIWEGKPRAAVEGAIYADEIAAAHEDGRVALFPYEPKLKVHAIFDLGWNDKMSIILAQRHISDVRVIEYIEDDHKTLDWYSAELKNKHLNWGTVFLPHDGAHGDYKTGKSAAQILRELQWKVQITPNQPVESGIKQARMMFPRVYFHKPKTERLVQCLKRYRRNIPTTTNEPATPVHDEWSHGADAFRYLSLVVPQMTNDTNWSKPINYGSNGVI